MREKTYDIGRRSLGASTVLEQDHFYSAYLVSLVTVLTKSQNRDDELFSIWSTGKRHQRLSGSQGVLRC
jgi:hypothetical protein